MKNHPSDIELADYLDGMISHAGKVIHSSRGGLNLPYNVDNLKHIQAHIAECDECLCKVVSAYESAGKKRKGKTTGNINLYLVLALISFALSFIVSRFFLQLLVATLLLGIKWVADSKSTKMLVMIYEAWKSGGEKEASRIFEALDLRRKI